MATITESPEIAGLLIVEPKIFTDDRGLFIETFRQEWLPEGAPTMCQANRADRKAGSLVGLHYHKFQEDFWYVPEGRCFVALHDLRASSPTDGNSLTLEIGPHNHMGVYIPRGVAHGFYAMTDMTITYLVDNYYNPADELGVAWNDPALKIDWPDADPVLSPRDQANPFRADIPADLQPQ
ncbi:MAG: dTDP-4-dehydrorhamnose 3,5-epimerase family protein [Acidimicrobiia bacterium]